MKVLMFGVDTGSQTHVHCERYIHLLQLAGCHVTFVEYRGVKLPDIPNVTYRRYPRRYQRLQKMGSSLFRVASAVLTGAAPGTLLRFKRNHWHSPEGRPIRRGGRLSPVGQTIGKAAKTLKRLGSQTIYYLRKQSMRLLWRAVRPDICHVQWVDENLWHIARAGLRPLIATAWGSDLNIPAKMSADDPYRLRISAALRSIDHLIVDSDDMVATAEQLAGNKLSTTLLPIGIDTERFRPGLYKERLEWRARLKIDPTAIVILTARQLGANYRPAAIIQAFAALNNLCRKQVYLIIRTFGHAIGVSVSELQDLGDKLNVSDHLRWVGDVVYSQLPGLYAAADLAVNFPIMDAFPVTFLECFACGLPVVSNRLASYKSNGASSYLLFAEDDSVGGLKTAIEVAIERLDRLQTLTAEARQHVVQNFDERISADILRHTYETILGRHDGQVDTA